MGFDHPLVYEVTMSTVKGPGAPTSKDGWVCNECLSSTALYGRSNKHQLPFNSLEEDFRASCTREALVYRYSNDARLVSTGIVVRQTRSSKWIGAGSQVRHWALVGTVAIRQPWLCAIPPQEPPGWCAGGRRGHQRGAEKCWRGC